MNVWEALQTRLEYIFEEFDNIYVSFSGGKDSSVLLNACIDFIRNNAPHRRIGVFHIDYEAQYQCTTEYVDRTLRDNGDILDIYRCCVPFKASTATSMHETYWRPWEKSKQDIWVRNKPENCFTEKDFDFFEDTIWDYDFQELFSSWVHEKKKAIKTCCLVGIRTQESLHRWRAIHSDKNYMNHEGVKWTKKIGPGIYNAYPVFDWKTEDIWTAHGRFGWDYNRLYDLFHMAGVPIHSQRVASPFHSAAIGSLRLYKTVEPNTWAKLIGRVNGVNFSGLYGGTTAMGWNSISLPEGYTWESYMHFLLRSLPEETRANYLDKLGVSIRFWREKGGVLSKETIEKLRAAGVKIEVGESTNYQTSKLPVRMDYIDDIDISEAKDIPTFKRMCICIMKNDHLCKYMGFSQTKYEIARRKNIIEKYRSLL